MGVPEGWRVAQLGDITSLITSGSRGWAKYYSEAGAKFIRITNLNRGTISLDFSDLAHVSVPNDSAEGRRTQLQPGDILISITADLGLIGLVPPHLGEAYVNQHIALARLSATDIADPFFIASYLTSGPAQAEFRRSNDAGAKAGLNLSTIRRTEVALPPLSEQRKIAAILSSVDEAIEKTQAVIDQVQVVKKALMQELLTKGLPGRHKKFKQTEIGMIPEEWETVTLASVACKDGLQTGPFGSQLKAEDYADEGIPVVMPKDLTQMRISEQSIARVPENKITHISKHRVRTGDLLFGRRGDIGRCGLVTDREDGWICGTGCLRFRPRADVDASFIAWQVALERSITWLTEHAVGQTMLNLNTSILGKLPLVLPSRDEQTAIVSSLELVSSRLNRESASLSAHQNLKRALMSALLTGDLRVPPAPNTP